MHAQVPPAGTQQVSRSQSTCQVKKKEFRTENSTFGGETETPVKREGCPNLETRGKPLQNVRETQTLEGNPRETLAKHEGNLNPERETRGKPLQNVRETQTFRRKPEGNPCKT